MTIKQQGGIFGRNPTFNDVTVDGTLTSSGELTTNDDLTVNGNVDVQGTVDTTGNIAVTSAGNAELEATRTSGATVKIQSQSARGMIGTFSNHGFRLLSNNTQRWELQTGGHIVPVSGGIYDLGSSSAYIRNIYLNGNLKPASGSGIDFSATSGTGTSELFDDYEEGTFTPYFQSSGATFNNNTFSGTYTKVGRLVHINMSCSFPTGSSGVSGTTSNTLFIKGLPYTPTTTGSGNVAPYKVDYPTGDWLYPQIRSDGSIRLYMIRDNNYFLDWTAAAFDVVASGAAMTFALTGTYTAD